MAGTDCGRGLVRSARGGDRVPRGKAGTVPPLSTLTTRRILPGLTPLILVAAIPLPTYGRRESIEQLVGRDLRIRRVREHGNHEVGLRNDRDDLPAVAEREVRIRSFVLSRPPAVRVAKWTLSQSIALFKLGLALRAI
jgi:hypothetical protein